MSEDGSGLHCASQTLSTMCRMDGCEICLNPIIQDVCCRHSDERTILLNAEHASLAEQRNRFIAGHQRVCCGRAGLKVMNLRCALQRMDLPSIARGQFNDFVATIPSTVDETKQSGFIVVANPQTCSPRGGDDSPTCSIELTAPFVVLSESL